MRHFTQQNHDMREELVILRYLLKEYAHDFLLEKLPEDIELGVLLHAAEAARCEFVREDGYPMEALTKILEK